MVINPFSSWEDITDRTDVDFDVQLVLQQERSKAFLSVSNMNQKVWKGLVVKIVLGTKNSADVSGENCVVMKVKGNTFYPVDINKRLGESPKIKGESPPP